MKPDDFEKRLRALEYFHALRLIPGARTVIRVDGRGFSHVMRNEQQLRSEQR